MVNDLMNISNIIYNHNRFHMHGLNSFQQEKKASYVFSYHNAYGKSLYYEVYIICNVNMTIYQ